MKRRGGAVSFGKKRSSLSLLHYCQTEKRTERERRESSDGKAWHRSLVIEKREEERARVRSTLLRKGRRRGKKKEENLSL
ncbi:hypothetical protein JCGZ_01898 [Jatropha curcas]|uniref:Uncharacterized protein n=1 Tax=Jatropha curcas TaxID=180498 RepID=A0A067LC93_JATCU|nr:hypothetical protein JCGZ_01898 [Jatropha curcas]